MYVAWCHMQVLRQQRCIHRTRGLWLCVNVGKEKEKGMCAINSCSALPKTHMLCCIADSVYLPLSLAGRRTVCPL